MDEIYMDDNGKPYIVNTSTGEITDAVNITVPVGTKIYTPEQQRIYQDRQQRQLEKEMKHHLQILAKDELGYFYFLLCENKLGYLSPETTARLIYLCTYMDSDCNLMKTRKTPMLKKDLKQILRLSPTAVYNFWNEVNPQYIVEDNEGLKVANKEIVRGKIRDNHQAYKRFYINQIRKIYEATDLTKHKNLGYVFQLLPYVNHEWNILCWNPDEINTEDIMCLTVKDLCDMMDYDYHNAWRLVDLYGELTFKTNGNDEYFLSFVINNRQLDYAKIFVNPKILYSGSDYKKVEVLGAFTKKEKRHIAYSNREKPKIALTCPNRRS